MGESLREALVTNDKQPADSSKDEKHAGIDEIDEISSSWIIREIQDQLWLAVPMIFVNLLDYSLYVVSLMFVGRIGELELASASVATSIAGVTGFSLVIGMGSALETLCGQAFGARQYRLVGIYLQRGVVVLNCISVPIAIVWLYTGSILKAIGQDPEIADAAGQYALWMIPTLFAYATEQALVKFLQAQSLVLPMVVCSILGLILHIPICWVFVNKSGMGYIGAAIANGISSVLNVTFLVLYVKFGSKCRKTWIGFSAEALCDLKSFIALALPSTAMICLEYWSFESVTLMSGLLPNPQLEMSTFAICLNSLGVFYMIPYGLSAAASTRVSNELGRGRISAAKRAVAVASCFGLSEGVILCTIVLSLRNVWAYAFTNETDVVHLVASFMPILAILVVFDACQAVLSGVTRGSGSQLLGACSNLVAYYVVGLPLAITLAFHFGLGGTGLWVGMIAALVVQTIALGGMAFFSDWKKEAQAANDRVSSGQLPTAQLD